MQIQIVEKLSDLDAVVDLIVANYPQDYSRDLIAGHVGNVETSKRIAAGRLSFLFELRQVPKLYITAVDNNRLVGFAMLSSIGLENLLDISWVCVDQHYRRKGIGKLIIQTAVELSRQQQKNIVLSTEIPDYYVKLGFRDLVEFQPGWHLMITESKL
jgi:predicted N-acetyltransferase YhbS